MNISICLAVQLVLCALVGTALPAPTLTTNKSMDDDFNHTVDISYSLTTKIIGDIPETHKSCIQVESMTLDPNDDLSKWQLLITSVGIPSDPDITLPSSDVSVTFSQILRGLQIHKRVLEVIKDHVSCPGVKSLVADLEDLLVQINSALNHLNATTLWEPEPLNISSDLSDYNVKVITHVTLVRLQRFGQKVLRFFRLLQASDP